MRYYASWLGRWTSGDPGGFVDGLNLYRYTRNNPVNGVDKIGYRTEQVSEQVEGDPIKKHTIVKGDNLTHIAEEYNTTVDKLVEWNNLAGSSMSGSGYYPGDELIVSDPGVDEDTKPTIRTEPTVNFDNDKAGLQAAMKVLQEEILELKKDAHTASGAIKVVTGIVTLAIGVTLIATGVGAVWVAVGAAAVIASPGNIGIGAGEIIAAQSGNMEAADKLGEMGSIPGAIGYVIDEQMDTNIFNIVGDLSNATLTFVVNPYSTIQGTATGLSRLMFHGKFALTSTIMAGKGFMYGFESSAMHRILEEPEILDNLDDEKNMLLLEQAIREANLIVDATPDPMIEVLREQTRPIRDKMLKAYLDAQINNRNGN